MALKTLGDDGNIENFSKRMRVTTISSSSHLDMKQTPSSETVYQVEWVVLVVAESRGMESSLRVRNVM